MNRQMTYHQARQAENERRFSTLYTPCSGNSISHDLACGHRVESISLSESCGGTCKIKTRDWPFICPDCIVANVRLEMTFESIDLASNYDDNEMADGGPSR